jgi:plasmid stabilization system protein ParE
MPRLIWTPSALLDVQRLYRFLVVKNPDAARRAVKSIRQGVKVLEQQPKVGRPVEDMTTSTGTGSLILATVAM